MIRIEGTRFGPVEVDDSAQIQFPNGLIGFPNERSFVLIEREGRSVAFLQSITTPALAFPVTDGAVFGPNFPEPKPDELARSMGIDDTDVAVLVIVAANADNKRLEANLLAPLIIDVPSRKGAQVVLDPRKYSAAASLADPLAEAKARVAALKEKLRKAHGESETAAANEELRAAANI